MGCLHQTLKDIEIICINDGSTDQTLSILLSFQYKDNRVKIINQVNKGLSAARNAGFMLAQGDYVYFLDSDDLVASSGILETCVYTMCEDSLDVLICNVERFFDKPDLKVRFPEFEKGPTIKKEYLQVYSGPDIIETLRKNHEWNSPVSLKVYDVAFLKKNKSDVFRRAVA